jgi:hypothetical protein
MGLACTGVVKFIVEDGQSALVEETLSGATSGPEAIRYLKANFSFAPKVVGEAIVYDYYEDPSYLSNEIDLH